MFIEASGDAFNKCQIWPLQNQVQLATLQVYCLVSYQFISNVKPEVLLSLVLIRYYIHLAYNIGF